MNVNAVQRTPMLNPNLFKNFKLTLPDNKHSQSSIVAFRATALKNIEETEYSVFEEARIGKVNLNNEAIKMALNYVILAHVINSHKSTVNA